MPEPIRFSLPLCFIFLGACLALTNSALFFSREQNERIFLLHKYRFVPADLQKMFRAKAMLLLRELLIFLLLSLAVYLFIVLGKYGTKAELAEPLCLFLSIAVFGLVFSGVELALNAVLLSRKSFRFPIEEQCGSHKDIPRGCRKICLFISFLFFTVCTLFLTGRLLRRIIQHSALDQRIQEFPDILSCRLFIHIV